MQGHVEDIWGIFEEPCNPMKYDHSQLTTQELWENYLVEKKTNNPSRSDRPSVTTHVRADLYSMSRVWFQVEEWLEQVLLLLLPRETVGGRFPVNHLIRISDIETDNCCSPQASGASWPVNSMRPQYALCLRALLLPTPLSMVNDKRTILRHLQITTYNSRWSAVPVAPQYLVLCDSERGSGPEGANDTCF